MTKKKLLKMERTKHLSVRFFRCKSTLKDALGEAADDPEDALDAGVDLLLPTPIFDWFTSKRSWFSDYL